MKRIIPLELVGNESLDFSLYDLNGEMIYKKGSKLTPGILMMLCFRNVYTKKEGIGENGEATYEELEFDSIVSHAATDTLIKNAKHIIKTVLDDEKLSENVCNTAVEIIVDEVCSKIQKMECIGQFRIDGEYNIAHAINVSTMSTALGIKLGLNNDDIKDLTLGAFLHDIGKMKIPREIITKPGKLDPEEEQIIKNHASLGYQYIKNELGLSQKVAQIALEHHEKYGGGGYPYGLKGKEITLTAQIVSVASNYDNLISNKPFEKAVSSFDALKKMTAEGSKSFNPYILYRFVYLANKKESSDSDTKE